MKTTQVNQLEFAERINMAMTKYLFLIVLIGTTSLSYARQETWDMLRSMQETNHRNRQQFQDAAFSMMLPSIMQSFSPEQQMINALRSAVMQDAECKMAQKTSQIAKRVNQYHLENNRMPGSARVIPRGTFGQLEPWQKVEAVLVAALSDMSTQNAQNALTAYGKIALNVGTDQAKLPALVQLTNVCLCQPQGDDDKRRFGVVLAMILCGLDGNGNLPMFIDAVEQKLTTVNSTIFAGGALFQIKQEIKNETLRPNTTTPRQERERPIRHEASEALKFAFTPCLQKRYL